MMRAIDFSGMRFGKMTVIEFAGINDKTKIRMWKCLCDCGVEKVLAVSNLRKTKSCGCAKTIDTAKHHHKRAYSIWQSMKARVKYHKRDSAKWYLEKGIGISDEWENSFRSFLRDMGDPPDGMMLERIDGNRGYCKDNCKWATPKEQAINRTSTNMFLFGGETFSTTDLAKVSGVPRTTIQLAIKTNNLQKYVPGAVLIKKGTKSTRSH